MRIVALAAALATAVAPTLSMAASCGQNEVARSDGKCACKQNYQRDAKGLCAIVPGSTAPGPAPMSHIPAGAIVVGGLVILAGVIIGVVAGNGDSGTVPTTSTTSTTPAG